MPSEHHWSDHLQHKSFDHFVSSEVVTLDVVSLPGLGPQHHDGDAGSDAAQSQVQPSALVQVLGRAVHQATATEVAIATWD